MKKSSWSVVLLCSLGCVTPDTSSETGLGIQGPSKDAIHNSRVLLESETLYVEGWMEPVDFSAVRSSEHWVNDQVVAVGGKNWTEGTVRLSRFYWSKDGDSGTAVVVSGSSGRLIGLEEADIQSNLRDLGL